MTGKILDADKNFQTGSKLNSDMVKISSSKSILSYQNGSALNSENRGCTNEEGLLEEVSADDSSPSEDPFVESQSLKSECLDLLRKKLISDLSLAVFSCDLENKLTKMEPIEISKERQTIIQKLVVQISQLSDPEKLLLYLKLPSSTSSPFDPLRHGSQGGWGYYESDHSSNHNISLLVEWCCLIGSLGFMWSIKKLKEYEYSNNTGHSYKLKYEGEDRPANSYFRENLTLQWPLNPLGNRQEIQQTIVWIKTHLEEDSEISIPKQDVYDQYLKYCENVSMKPLSTADFGKVMKQVYPGVRPRRLGTRGNSRYCYSGMRNTCKLPTPILPRSSMENPISNGCASGVSSFLPGDSNKLRKLDKTKRKLSSTNFRNEKCSTTKKSSCTFSVSTCQSRAAKRSKIQKDVETTELGETNNERELGFELEDVKSEIVDLGDVKCEDCSDNSFSAFDIECRLEAKNATGEEPEKERENKLGESNSVTMNDGKGYGKEKIVMDENSNEATLESGTTSVENQLSASNRDQTIKLTNRIAQKPNDLERSKEFSMKKQKGPKAKDKKCNEPNAKQASKNLKKLSYVPIQPKPAEAATNISVRFKPTQGTTIEKRKDTEGIVLCDESDSQEPEEEIVRYFKHLDESEMTATNSLVEQAVKNIDSSSVQISSISQLMTDSRNQVPYGADSEDILNDQMTGTQSCFKDYSGNNFGLREKPESVYVTRPQSTIELPDAKNSSCSEPISDSDSDGKKNKISHLRILLEKSISSCGKNPYSRWSFGGPNVTRNSRNALVDPVGQSVPNEPNLLQGNVKTPEHDLKSNGIKAVSKGLSVVPNPNPSTRKKYFNFTPISPGSQSPLKSSSSSSFVSPRNTPVSMSRQNSHDHFLPPSERKPALSTENFFNVNKSLLIGNGVKEKGCKSPNFVQGSRPRSNSSTNFYRSKTRRNSSKLSELGGDSHPAIKSQVQPLTPNSYSMNSPFLVQTVGTHFVGGESLSGEVEKFLENNTKVSENQVATLRSRSVPLNRMIGESSWVSTPIYPAGYFNSGNGSDVGKIPEMVSGPGGTSQKVVQSPSISGFVDANNGLGPLAGEIFTGHPSIVSLNDQYFSGNFQRSNDEAFAENQPFNGEDSAFANKLDLSSSGTFDGTFASDSDAALTDNIKSYLPDFGSLDSKSLVEGSGGNSEVSNEGKLFKSSLYEGNNENLKDPVITSFKPVLMNEISSSPGSPVLNFFGGKMNEDSQQLIEFFDFED